MHTLFALFTIDRVFFVNVVLDTGVSLPLEAGIVCDGLSVLDGCRLCG